MAPTKKLNFAKFIIRHRTRKFSLYDNQLIGANPNLLPSKFLELCQNYTSTGLTEKNYELYIYDTMDINAFDLFIDLIYTPIGCKIPNPHKLNIEDIQGILRTFSHCDGIDSFAVDQIIKRLKYQRKKSVNN